MAVHLTRIYTRTGDAGTTALGDMSRVRKTDPRLVAYADVDEANSAIGVALALGRLDPPIAEVLRSVQNDLFDVGADLCVPVADNPEFPPLRVTDAQVERLERACDEFNEGLRKLDPSCCPAGRPAPPCCTRPGPSSAARSAAPGRCSEPTRTGPRRCRRATSTGSRTCCSSWPGWPTRTATCCGRRERTASYFDLKKSSRVGPAEGGG